MARLFRCAGVALAGLACIGPTLAEEWPSRPMTMVVPFAAGGPADTVGRILAPRLGELLGQQVIVENMGGFRRHDRQRARGEGRARRLPVRARQYGHTRRQSDVLQNAALQRRDRLRAGHADRTDAAGAPTFPPTRADHRTICKDSWSAKLKNGPDRSKQAAFPWISISAVMAGHSASQTRVNALVPGHPRLYCKARTKTWMPGIKPGMTVEGKRELKDRHGRAWPGHPRLH